MQKNFLLLPYIQQIESMRSMIQINLMLAKVYPALCFESSDAHPVIAKMVLRETRFSCKRVYKQAGLDG